jgi:mannitol/fructose-specific phosphotransferase system IIA component (Ntr-type)
MGKNLVELLQEDMIDLNVLVTDWKDALKKGTDLLVKSGGAEPRYYNAMIEMIEDLGPYVVIAPGLALGHAGPDKGVNFTCFSLITLKTPVNFGVPGNDPVEIVFSFAAPNKEEHMQALRQMALFCMEKENLEAIKNAEEKSEIRELLIQFFAHEK